ncbi:MAG: extracellular solute-binding protein [Butyrivibrio sp.]|nr:extracellular solute-binding protein [Muribaculum sp.]MCM1552502.1 extracellular solute-binding protein [Butyrivibrio sp.]
MTACSREADGSTGYEPHNGRGNQTDNSIKASATQEREWVYVPEAIELGGGGHYEYGYERIVDNDICYIERTQNTGESLSYFCRYSIADGRLTRIPVNWQEGDASDWEIGKYYFDEKQDIWLITSVYSSDFGKMRRFLCRFDAQGDCLSTWEITEQAGSGVYISDLVVDAQGRSYLFTYEKGILLYDSNGNYDKSVIYDSAESPEDAEVRATDIGADGRVYACIDSMSSSGHCRLTEVDFEKGQLVELVGDCGDVTGFCAVTEELGDWAAGYDFIFYDEHSAYGYTLSDPNDSFAKDREELLAWLESDVNGSYVERLGIAGDGRLYASVADWQNEDCAVMLLTRTKAEEAPKREDLTLATIDGGSDLSSLVVKYNRGNANYHITVKDYASPAELYIAMLTGEAVDIIDLTGVDVRKMAARGIFEDIAPYVERSEAFSRSDFVDGLLEVYTYEDKLVSIPTTFALRTVAGDKALLSNQAGLSLEELLELAKARQGTKVFDGLTREELLQYLMMFNEDVFVDWDAGECHFDSETFQEVLELLKGFPEDAEGGAEESSLPARLQRGEVLFAIADIYGFKDLQLYDAIYGERSACVGFPTADGSGGTLLYTENAFAVAACSEHKDAAWDFVEGVVLAQERERYFYWHFDCFPTLQRLWRERAEEIMTDDEERVRAGGKFGERTYEDGWTYTGHALTQGEVDRLTELLSQARPAALLTDDETLRIISEEAAAYYSGQKSAADAAGIIQNRVQLYLNENISE